MPPVIIRAGELRHIIQIVQPTLKQDSFGGWKIDCDALVAQVRAKVEALSGRELYAAQQKVSEVTHRITIRWMCGIKAKQNVWFDSREFQIQAVENPDEIHHLLYLLCLERDDSAREGAGGILGPNTVALSQPYSFTATAGQTVFTLPYSPPRGIQLFWGGPVGGLTLQSTPGDYSVAGAVITTARAAEAGDLLVAYIL